MRAWLLLLLLPVVAQGDAGALQSRDFAYGMALEMDGDGALYSLPVPEGVYTGVTRSDLGDLRIFNSYGEVVPHLLQHRKKADEPQESPVSLKFFPLYQERPWEEEIEHIQVATDGTGTIIEIDRKSEEPQDSPKTLDHYLIDASGIDLTINKLILDWDKPAEGFMAPIRVEYSNDLVNWYHLVAAATLADLTYEGHSLSQHEIDLPRHEARYYRISWPLTEKGISLKSIHASVVQLVDELPRERKTLSPTVTAERPGEYLFSLSGNYPIDKIEFTLPQVNTVAQVKLLSRNDDKSPWRVRHQGLLYTLNRDDQTLSNPPIVLPLTSDSYWRLEVDQEGGGFGTGSPEMEVGWIPHRLIFVARGEMPFTLAFGASEIEPPEGDISPLINRLDKEWIDKGIIKLAHAGGRFELGGKRTLEPTPSPLPWKKWLLWSVLIIGVLILALMARGLYRQMNSQGSTD